MQLTPEQLTIIHSTGNIKINAVAGSGKTTTVIEYAKARPANSRILYLAFNKSVKIEAAKRFIDKGLNNVRVETAHSLAYRHIVPQNNYTVTHGYKTNEIVEILSLQGNGEKHAEYIIANHINKLIAYFCNSDKQKVQDLDYLDIVADAKAKVFVSSMYDYIVEQSRIFLGKMNKGEIAIMHDFYLKKFQLSNPILPYDYILFDEGQDASPAMLDVFFKQKATKVIVGDTHQQIYGWRFAVNSLEKADFDTHYLSTSFRFSPAIAGLAMEVLKYKKYINQNNTIKIVGAGSSKAIEIKAVIARTNLGLLLKAIEYITEKKKVQHIYFEGNINSYTYADDGASLYDVLHLYNNRKHLIRDKLIKAMKNLTELEDYVRKTEDVQLGMMVEIVKEYGNEIPSIIQSIKEKHVGNDEKDKAEIIFSTVHRCKGMEYDTVQLANDFITEEKLGRQQQEGKLVGANLAKINEEINLLYVAITRTKNSLYISEILMPDEYIKSVQIHVIKEPVAAEKPLQMPSKTTGGYAPKTTKIDKTNGGYTVAAARDTNTTAYMPWTPALDDELTTMYFEGVNPRDVAKHFGRTVGAIMSRVKKLELE